MTNVSVAKPINCPDLKKKIADSYEMAGAIPLLARDFSGKNKHKKKYQLERSADSLLDKAVKYAAIYTALCK